MTDRELLQMALDALIETMRLVDDYGWHLMRADKDKGHAYKTIEALRARLAQPEPVIYARKEGDLIVADLPQVPTGGGGISKDEQPEPEPVGWIGYFEGNLVSFLQTQEQVNQFLENTEPVGQVSPVYAAPPQREWVGLTDKDREWCDEHSHGNTSGAKQKAYGRAIEAKLREKNT